jgi:cell envelope-related function transcriptional attenuator common domain
MKKNKKKKISIGLKIIITIIVLILIVGITAFALVKSKLGKINQASESEFEVIPPESEYFETEAAEDILKDLPQLKPEEVEWDAQKDIMYDKDITNILLIGQDRREGEGRARADSIILATINKKTKSIQLTSIMRDLYVQIPGYSDNRINAAYAFGGMELLEETVELNFGIEIDGNIEIDFNGFIASIDTIGGIEMELNQEEALHLNAENGWNLISGVNHLTGEQALAFSRIRYVGNSDYERTDRQRRVVMTVFDKMQNAGISALVGLVDEIFPLLTTDLTHGDMIAYTTSILVNRITGIESYRIPVDGGFQAALISGMQVLVPDLAVTYEYLQEIIYNR